MIFVTVGVQLPFDRLINTVDAWAGENKVKDIFAQVGDTTFQPKHIQYTAYLDSSEAEKMFKKATVIISHAGMGSVLNAMKYKKPIIAMPRSAEKGEHRNNHQQATARWVSDINGISIAWNEEELMNLLIGLHSLKPGQAVSEYASDELVENLKTFLSS